MSFGRNEDQNAYVNVESIGLVPVAATAVDNKAMLAARFALQKGGQEPLFFAGKVFPFDHCVVADGTGRRFEGMGLHKLDAGDDISNFNFGSRIVARTPVVNFNGTSITAAGTSGSATITLTGHTVRTDDTYQTVIITGGTNFTTGTYHILSVSTGSNQWTLDRACATGTASGMTGQFKKTIWRDQSFGNLYDGLSFRGTATFSGTSTPSTRAAIGLHIRTQGADTFNTGKQCIRNCSFANLDVAILVGKGLAQFNVPPESFEGQQDNNADHLEILSPVLHQCEFGFVTRSSQNVHHTITNMFPQATGTFIYVERGGKILANGIWSTGSYGGAGPILLRIGGQDSTSTVSTPITLNGVSIDAPSSSAQLIVCDGTGDSSGCITLRDVRVNQWTSSDSGRYFTQPMVVARDGYFIVLEGIQTLTPRNDNGVYKGTLVLDSNNNNFQPTIEVRNSFLLGAPGLEEDVVTTPELLIDRDQSTAGTQVRFSGNVYAGYLHQYCKEGIYECDGAGGGSWIYTGYDPGA
jgi:hypothetical protein